MTISSTASQQTFLGNGVANPFSASIVAAPSNATTAQASANIQVTYTDTDGAATILSSSSYTLAFNADYIGFTVTYPTSGSPIANGTSLTVSRIVPLTQTTSISNQGDFAPEVIEAALDNLCLEIQQVSARGGAYRGTWAADIDYNFGDIVVDGANGEGTGNYYNCIIANTSDDWTDDLATGDWNLIIDAQNIATEALNSVTDIWTFSASNNMSDPGTGLIHLNNSTVSLTTAIAISALSANTGNPNLGDFIASWDDSSSSNKGTITIRESGSPATFAIFTLNSSLTNNTTWLQLPVTYVTGSGSFSATESLAITFSATGNAGSMTGPASSVNSEIALFNGTSGSAIKSASGTGFVKVVSGVMQTPAAGIDNTIIGGSTPAAGSFTTLSATGIITNTQTSAGGVTVGAWLKNVSSAANTTTEIIMQPSTVSNQGYQIRAINDGSDNISLLLVSSVAGSGTQRVNFPFAGGMTVGSATTGTPTDGQVNATGYLVNGAALSTTYTLLSTQTASTSASLAFTGVLTSAYDYYIFLIQDIRPASNTQHLQFFTSANNGGAYAASYNYMITGSTTTAAVASVFAAAQATLPIMFLSDSDNAAASAISGKLELFSPNGTVRQKGIRSNVTYTNAGALFTTVTVDGSGTATTAVNAVKFQMSSGNITSGKIYCYGVKNT